jgi:DNA-binding beta-propeller fold protein YncE
VLSLDEEGKVTEEIPVGGKTRGIVVVDGAPWIAVAGSNEVVRVDPLSGELLHIEVGRGPTDVAYGAGAIWVTNSEDGSLSRIELGN